MTLVFGEAAVVGAQQAELVGFASGTAVDAAGVPFVVDWAPVAGATSAQVDDAGMAVRPAWGTATPISLGTAHAVVRDKGIEVTVPGGAAPVRDVTLSGLHLTSGDVDVRAVGDLGGLRLSVAVRDPATGAFGAPVVTVPPLDAAGEVPSRLGGGSLQSGVLTLPDLVTSALRITIVDGDDPLDFEAQSLSVGAVTVRRAPVPADLALAGADGQVLWAFPGWYDASAPPADVDLVVPVELALAAALADGGPPATTITLTAVTRGNAVVVARGPRGALVRTIDALDARTAGTPAVLAVDPPLSAELPETATGDLVIRYEGIRRHPVSDSLGPGPYDGPVVGSEPVARVLPSGALDGERIAAVAVFGRAPVDCDLSVRLVDAADGTPLGDPGVATVPAAPGPEVGPLWVTLPPAPAVSRPVAVAVTATRGRLLWAGDPEPLVAIAVHDPDPGGRPLRIGADTVALDAPEVSLPAHAFAPATFAAGGGPVVDSDCWCEVQLRGVVLRYAR